MGITASGIGSGLDINSLVAQLVKAESRPMALLQGQQKTIKAKISSYGQLSSALAGFQTAARTLGTASQPGTSGSIDAAALKTAVTGFAKAWNDLRSTVATQTAFNEVTRTGAALHGDSGPTSLLSQLRTTMAGFVAGAGSLDTLSDLGISFQKDGSMSIADSKLQAAIDTVPTDVTALLSGASGFTTRLGTQLTQMLSDTGIVNLRTEGFTASLRGLARRELAMQDRLEALESRYRAQFTRLDAALTRMQSTSNWLGQQLASLGKNGQ